LMTGVQFPARVMMGFFLFATASRPALEPIGGSYLGNKVARALS